MPATVDKPGYWLVISSDGKLAGVRPFASAGTLPGAKTATFVGANTSDVRAGLPAAITRSRAFMLYEYPGGVAQLTHDVLSKGFATMRQGQGSLQWDLAPTAILGATVGFIAAPIVGLGAGATAATEGAIGTGEAAGAGAVGGSVASKGASALSKLATGAKAAAGALTVASLFTDPGIWKGLGMVLAGAILAFLALRQLGAVAG